MPLAAGTRLGPYELVAPLGAGGMGEVYKARDTRLGRTVAIKVLPQALAHDRAFRERFDREARAVSQLDHPHICPLYDVGDENGLAFLVMQFLEGESLAARTIRGALPLSDALAFAVQIADALDRSHHAGIVHRDIKPGNIFLTRAGAILLDFGLAARPPTAAANAVTLPPMADRLTAHGTIVGTVQYMAPEQLEGEEADPRSDIFGFGAVLYEMVTGRKAFDGRSQASLIAGVMHANPAPIRSLRPDVPLVLEHIVDRCLAKNPDDRWQTAGDLKRELDWVASVGTQPEQQAVTRRAFAARWKVTAYASTIGAVVLAVMLVYLLFRPGARLEAGRSHSIKLFVTPGNNARLSAVQFAISPDGSQLAYIALTGQERQLWIYSVATAESRLVTESEDVTFPFWSPDGRHLAFFSDRGLMRTPAAGGPVQHLAPASMSTGGAWSEQGVLLFGGLERAGIYRMPANGGVPIRVTTPDTARGELLHAHPRFLPGGQAFLYLARSQKPEYTGIYVRSLERDDRKLLLETPTHAEYAEPGLLLFVRDSLLMAQPFDVSQHEIHGEPFTVTQDVNVNIDNGGSAVSASREGSLLFHAGQVQAMLRWLDRSGRVLETLAPRAMFRDVELSPDGRSALVRIMPKETTYTGDLWTIDLARGVSSRLTVDAGWLNARWAPSGTHVLFDAQRGPTAGIYQVRSDGTGSEELVWKTAGHLADASLDGHLLVQEGRSCTVVDTRQEPHTAQAAFDLGKISDMPPVRLSINCGRFAPGGRLIAYSAAISGRPEVYVMPFPGGTPRIQVSRDGGREPRWRRDGRELFYLGPDGTVMSVDVTLAPALQVSAPHALFRSAMLTSGPAPSYSITPDGKQFLMIDPVADRQADALTLIAHWGTSSIR
jgi:Tol biopolymer transport system component/tRNA A-37 threonylcarbamoyl transferase component Bud32